ncbi:hypothetical protein M6B38_205480 [Iris pallida]|uniref:NADH dehydrogenase subunit 4L n=1 Tax=Iris pallida TaxID=29817 RepID=A0AAX6E7U4_IRIPA|nr:hypothetical protein M6B38_205480 [Iris pallida]
MEIHSRLLLRILRNMKVLGIRLMNTLKTFMIINLESTVWMTYMLEDLAIMMCLLHQTLTIIHIVVHLQVIIHITLQRRNNIHI